MATFELDLNQSAAVNSAADYLVINAGAGSGKTRTLTERVIKKIRDGISPERLMVITFTRKAAKELIERIELSHGTTQGMAIGTFHSVCYKHILNQYAPRIGYDRPISIYDEWLSADVLSDVLISMGFRNENFRNIHPSKIFKWFADFAETNPDNWIRVEEAYRSRLRSHNAIDYDGIIQETIRILSENPDVAAELRNRYEWVFVDEFQDTDHSQMKFIEGIAPKHLTIVGDDYQMIYGWRGARMKNLFEAAAKSEVVNLDINYRSAAVIVEAANRLIRHNRGQMAKVVKPRPDPPEGTIEIHYSEGGSWIGAADMIFQFRGEFKLRDIAILCRSNYGAAQVYRRLNQVGIPARLISRGNFWDSDIVRKIVYHLQFLMNPRDYAAWSMIVNYPETRIDQIIRMEAKAAAIHQRCSLIDASGYVAGGNTRLREWSQRMFFLSEMYSESQDLETVIDAMNEVLYWSEFYRERNLSFPDRALERIKFQGQLLSSEGDPTVEDFLIWYNARDSQDQLITNENRVIVSTIHTAKGLEWPIVILPGWDKDKFPSKKSRDFEEERRVAYVAITRAKKECHIIYGKEESRFAIETQAPITASIEDYVRAVIAEPHDEENFIEG